MTELHVESVDRMTRKDLLSEVEAIIDSIYFAFHDKNLSVIPMAHARLKVLLTRLKEAD